MPIKVGSPVSRASSAACLPGAPSARGHGTSQGCCRDPSKALSWPTTTTAARSPAVTLHQGDALDADAIRSFLALDELFPKDLMTHIKSYFNQKKPKVKGVHIWWRIYGTPVQLFYGIWDPSTQTLRHWDTGNERLEATTLKNAADCTVAVCADNDAASVLRGQSPCLLLLD
ncbi:hypothetical protein C7999DRAFT_30986 [Corynascus novoguineensis]|uniref:Uncharacterized protein n=1 Tax=Corynascus novoguineensis TaxID=1126955 RepID=A0AAN7CUI5_9PEZI|nr:hypothetical protein C7999DRAFT_30986 [Corynascus novoguineensis]